MVAAPTTKVYLDQPNRSTEVMLKVVKVLLHNGDRVLETYAVLDDGSERSLLLPHAVQRLRLTSEPETLTLRTVHQRITQLHGASVSFHVSSLSKPQEKYLIRQAFTSDNLSLSEHSYPVTTLQRKYKHLCNLPLPPVDQAQPLLLIGSDMAHLLTPIEPVRSGPSGGPIAVHTKLGWSLQGPTSIDQVPASEQQCLLTVTDSPTYELFKNVGRLWQIDTLPYANEKQVTRSKQDQQALDLLQTSTIRITIDKVERYATPLLRRDNSTTLHAPKEAVLPSLRRTERRLAKDSQRVQVYCHEIQNLTDVSNWRYLDSANNPVNDITRGKTLKELARPPHWHQGPDFLRHTEDFWPTSPTACPESHDVELRKASFCGNVTVRSCPQLLDVSLFSTWKDLIQATVQSLHGAADPDPIRPNILSIGRYDASLPQAVYDTRNVLGSR
ncbi:uncharacterized protein LOC129176971 [Dunckerocampus dactyliophorus]|uniref:uncharacterized protein LOC129176971 n=1 Tax=Dunckerocampus dactyliophorus TaxID=161453 RepID=UPI0024055629|nr:uncharacterized protein LOC129176971 [Dunckerocampus dactyliophorus]